MSVPPAAVAWRLGLFGALWLILCGGELRSWPFGLPTVILATWLNLQLAGRQSHTIRPFTLVRFAPFFLGKSILSGIDVMVRVLHPRLPIDPGLLEYPLTISHEGGRVLLANCITLLPGTISAQIKGDSLTVHTLDKTLPVLPTIQDLERRISSLYALCPLPGPGRGLP